MTAKIKRLVEKGAAQLYFFDLARDDKHLESDLVQIIIRSLVENPNLQPQVKLAMLTRWTSSNTPGAADAVRDLLRKWTAGSTQKQPSDPALDAELLAHAAFHDQGHLFRYLLDHGYSTRLLDSLIRYDR
jgi:hypothetical protein